MDVTAWLRSLGLERYAEAFRANEIDREVLPELTEADLEKLGLPLGPRKKLLKAITGLSAETAAASSEPAPSPRAVLPEAERRQLTVMFADLVGSTELAARLDPEDLRSLMRAYHDCCGGVIMRLEGHVAKYLGDGILAYFGWPRTHEDDAERAVRAGLELISAVANLKPNAGPNLAVRVGIATGLAVVGDLLGEGAAREEAVVGETPNLAARLQALAEPSAVVVGPSTRRLVGGLFVLHDLGWHDLKGFAEPVQAWRVVGEAAAASRFAALRGAYRTPLIGRQRELEALEAARREVEDGRGQLVATVGEPGVGKSRLIDEVLQARSLAGWRVLRCGCLPYGTSTPWLPVIELIRNRFGIEDRDNRRRAGDKIEAGVAALGAAMAPAAAPLRALLDLPTDDAAWSALNPPQRRRRLIDAVKTLLVLESKGAPLVLLVEDLHWADGETVALLDSLVESLPGCRVLLLITYRPEFRHGWGNRACYQQLRVDPLPRPGAEQLLAALLGADPGLADLKRELIARTEGNPLFLEEAVRDLVERRVLTGEPGWYRLTRATAELRLPETVQAILAARIDRLSGEARQLLQRAAVIGRTVPRALLEAVGDLPGDELNRRLDELQAAEMVRETRLLPEVEYTFRHALTHDVAYDGLLRDVRRDLHRRAGEAIEALYPERLVELAESLADHFERGEAWAKAARYALDAAEKTKARYGYPVGLRFAERARDAAARNADLKQEWIRANVVLGDLASLLDELDLANQSYDQALAKVRDPAERRHIANKRHEPHHTERAGARIAYYVHGSGEETLVFVSPIGYGLVPWQPVVERLCQEFRVITIDPRGTGRSDPISRSYLSRDHGLDIAAVLRRCADRPVVAVGLSRAGFMMTWAAAAEPTLVKALVLVGTPAGPLPSGHPLLEQVLEERGLLERGERECALQQFAARTLSEPDTEELQEQRVVATMRLSETTIRSFYDPRPPSDSEIIPVLNDLRIPVLIMHGTADRRVPFDDGRQLAESVERARLYPFEGRCHTCTLTATDEFCEVLRHFARHGTAGESLPPRTSVLRSTPSGAATS